MGKGFLLGLLAETPLHAGAGQSAGVVDLPVAREGASGLPHIPETGLKGALRQWAQTARDAKGEPLFDEATVKLLFGTTEAAAEGNDAGEANEPIGGAGELLISTARLLFLPLRRLDAAYAWTTTPYMLSRIRRDASRLRLALDVPAPRPAECDELLLAGPARTASVFLEEYVFTPKALEDDGKLAALTALLAAADDAMQGRVAVMHDDEFAWFAANALPVDARNSLDAAKISQNLWYEETLPPDTLLYAMILPRLATDRAMARFADFKAKLRAAAYLQAGGNETVGHGWLRLAVVEG